jgi:hypothetical protein
MAHQEIRSKRQIAKALALLGAVAVFAVCSFITDSLNAAVTVSAVVPGICGNSIAEVNEQCDDTDLASRTCASLNFGGGTLGCSPTCSFDVSQCTNLTPPPTSGGGGSSGGGGGGNASPSSPSTPTTSVFFSGRAYPLSKVTILRDGQIAITTIAGPDSNFKVSLNNLTAGHYIFSVYGEDNRGNRSSLFTFPVDIADAATTLIEGIFIAPTISVDKSEVKRGDTITIFGQSAPASKVMITVNSEVERFLSKNTDANGVYLVAFDTSPLELGQHSTKSKSIVGDEISTYSNSVGFKVGTQNVMATVTKKFLKGDLNEDDRVNLIDFSIAAYWYKKVLNAVFIDKDRVRLNGDGKIDLVDFSIMAYYWTG